MEKKKLYSSLQSVPMARDSLNFDDDDLKHRFFSSRRIPSSLHSVRGNHLHKRVHERFFSVSHPSVPQGLVKKYNIASSHE